MPIVDLKSMIDHAQRNRYAVVACTVNELEQADRLLRVAEQSAAPLVLMVEAATQAEQGYRLLPSLEQMARNASTPVAIQLDSVRNLQDAEEAIRQGCNGIAMEAASDGDANLVQKVVLMAAGCGIPVEEAADPAVMGQSAVQALTESGCSEAIASGISKINCGAVTEEGAAEAIQYSQATGQAEAVLAEATPWDPVEHLIIYNAECTPEHAVEMMAEGRRVLSQIPGVRSVFTGEAIQQEANYRYTWLVRFCHPAVIESYREHPDQSPLPTTGFGPLRETVSVLITAEVVGRGGNQESWVDRWLLS